jgi:hypothetical protein
MIVLGPQRRPTLAAVARAFGAQTRFATVTAGWLEREPDVGELHGLLEDRAVNLRLWQRWQDVLEADPELATAELNHREVLAELQDLYAVRLQHAAAAVTAVKRAHRPRVGAAALADAEETVRQLDLRHLARVRQVDGDFAAAWRPAERDAVARHRAEVAGLLHDVLVVAGGHVGVLLHVLRLFGVLPAGPVIAWSAGAMALTERVVLFTEDTAEVLAPGLAVLPEVVLFPHARRRLDLGDADTVGRLARRFAPDRCVVLDDGVQLDFGGGLPETAKLMAADGRVA